jgi:hypothetical protein
MKSDRSPGAGLSPHSSVRFLNTKCLATVENQPTKYGQQNRYREDNEGLVD